MGMRELSQAVFALFRRTFIEPRRNFFQESHDIPAELLLGGSSVQPAVVSSVRDGSGLPVMPLDGQLAAARAFVSSFVTYQLSNRIRPNGSGVGCGLYDESGKGDGGGISQVMNEYVFDVCFNPNIVADNSLLFLDYCLSHLSNRFFSGREEPGFIATKESLTAGFDPSELARYWLQHRATVLEHATRNAERKVYGSNYVATYAADLDNCHW
jgi:hypothetical protein